MFDKILRRVRLFSDLDDDEIRRLAGEFSEILLPSGHRIFRHGDPADAFYIVRDGSVALYTDRTGQPLQLQARLGPGDFFGEVGLFDTAERSSSARTSDTCRLLMIPKDELLEFLEDHPEVAIKLQIAAARRHSQNVSVALDLGQRREVRIRLGQKVSMEPQEGASREVFVENLSLGGLCMRGAPSAWERYWTVRFNLQLDDVSLPVVGKVTWRQGESVGIAFIHSDDQHDERVQGMLRKLLTKLNAASPRPRK